MFLQSLLRVAEIISVRRAAAILALSAGVALGAATGSPITYHGKVTVAGKPYDGVASLKFALVNRDGTKTFWSNDGTSRTGEEPVTAVSLLVVKGNYTVVLGDVHIVHMRPMSNAVPVDSVLLRAWCSVGDAHFVKAADQSLQFDKGRVVEGARHEFRTDDTRATAAKQDRERRIARDLELATAGAPKDIERSIKSSGALKSDSASRAEKSAGSIGRDTAENKSREYSDKARSAHDTTSEHSARGGDHSSGGGHGGTGGVYSTSGSAYSGGGYRTGRAYSDGGYRTGGGHSTDSEKESSGSAAPTGDRSISTGAGIVMAKPIPAPLMTPVVLATPSEEPMMTTSAIDAGATESFTEQTIQRTPHIDIDPGVAEPKKNINVSIYVDTTEAHQDEDSANAEFHFPDGTDEIKVVVYLLLSHQFRFIGNLDSKELVIPRHETQSDKVTFKLKVEDYAEGDGYVTALFFQNGYPCGKVRRFVRIGYPDESTAAALPLNPPATATAVPAPVASMPPPTQSQISVHKEGPDMTIVVMNTDAGRTQYFVLAPKATTPNSPVYRWDAYSDLNPKGILESFYDRFDKDYPKTQARNSLNELGETLFKRAPAKVGSVLKELIDKKEPPRTVLIFSEEPDFAWELMIPHWNDRPTFKRRPLGVMSAVARWTQDPTEAFHSPARHVPVGKSLIWAPDYNVRKLNPNAERDLLGKVMSGKEIEPATYDGICDELAKTDANVLHFVCHGSVDPNHPSLQTIVAQLQEIPPLPGAPAKGDPNYYPNYYQQGITAGELTRCDGVKGFCSKRPLIFLNACQVGRTVQTFNGADGFGPAFLKINAGGVVAPLWSVFDLTAPTIATQFYNEVHKHPDVPFAKTLQSIREKAYEGELVEGLTTYAAYIFYGDPLGVPSSNLSSP